MFYISFYFNLGEDIGEIQNLGELFLRRKSQGETYPALLELCHTNDLKAIGHWVQPKLFPFLEAHFLLWYFDGFLTNRTFISLVGLKMVVKCFLANANFVTNVTLHVFLTMNYPMEPQFLWSEKRFPTSFTNKSHTW